VGDAVIGDAKTLTAGPATEWPRRSMVIPSAATISRSTLLVRFAVSLYVVFGLLSAWQASMFTAPSAWVSVVHAKAISRGAMMVIEVGMSHRSEFLLINPAG